MVIATDALTLCGSRVPAAETDSCYAIGTARGIAMPSFEGKSVPRRCEGEVHGSCVFG